jgi:AraC-like DNA-binding protein
MQFVGKPYGSYHYALRDSMRKRYDSGDYHFVLRTVKQLRSLPDKLGDHQWQLESDFLLFNYEHDYRKGSDLLFEERLKTMLDQCDKYGNKVFRLRILRRLLDLYGGDLVKIIRTAWQVEKAMADITPQEYPDVIDCEYHLAELYFQNHDYLRSGRLCHNIVNTTVFEQNQRYFVHARNCLGLIQRTYYHNLDMSDRWFKSILQFDKRYKINYLRNQWMAIVKGELGRNEFLRHHYTKAEPLMRSSLDSMRRDSDFSYSYYMACDLANCYCALKQYNKALHCIGIADFCFKLSPVTLSREKYYFALAKCYSGLSRPDLTALYMDSTSIARDDWDLHHSLRPFLQIEKEMGQAELQQEAAESHANYRKFLFILFASIIVSIGLCLYIILYEQKQKAYRALVLKNQQWAEDNKPYLIISSLKNKDQKEADNKLYQYVEEYLEKSKCYCDANLNLDSLCKSLGVNRTYLSSAINKTNDNFNSLINRYRIRYAIRLITDDKELSIEDVALASGFNNRKSFYNAFRAITGLSPIQFKSNMIKQEKG